MIGTVSTEVLCLSGRTVRDEQRELIEESPLTIDIHGADKFTIMRTPGNDEELVAGFLLTEGIIDGLADVTVMKPCPDDANRFRVKLAKPVRQSFRRNLAVNSACGFCGRDDLQKLWSEMPRVKSDFFIEPTALARVPELMRGAQPLFALTGGSHAAALINTMGELRIVREDLGRHNALDKAIGAALLRGMAVGELGAFLSGRASLEMVSKCARSGIGFIASISAPSSLAVEAARALNITLCGFVRGREATIYHAGTGISGVEALLNS